MKNCFSLSLFPIILLFHEEKKIINSFTVKNLESCGFGDSHSKRKTMSGNSELP